MRNIYAGGSIVLAAPKVSTTFAWTNEQCTFEFNDSNVME
jgi:hypothetical protein